MNVSVELLNQLQLTNEINSLIEKSKIFAAIYLNIDIPKVLPQTNEYSQDEQIMQLLADISREAVKQHGNQSDFIGYPGGRNVMVVTTVPKVRTVCRRILAEFDLRTRNLHRAKGVLSREKSPENEERVPVIYPRAVAVTNEYYPFQSYAEVLKAAEAQLARLRNYPGLRSFFDLKKSDIPPDNTGFPISIVPGQQEEIKALQGVSDWLARLLKDIKSPLTTLEESLKSLEAEPKNKANGGQKLVNNIRESVNKLDNVIEMTESIILATYPPVHSVPEEVNLKDYLDWVREQVKGQTDKRNIAINVQGTEEVEVIQVDGKSLAQSLFYLVEGEVLSSDEGDLLQIKVAAARDQSVRITISNPNHHVPQQMINQLLKGQLIHGAYDTRWSRIYLAKIIVQGLDGTLDITSSPGQGIAYSIVLPQSWQGSMQEVNALVLATDISRKHARAEIKKLQHLTTSLSGELPAGVLNSFDTLRYRVQELGILCNRSLYLVEDYRSQLEARQERWLQREIEQIHTVETLVNMCQEIARPVNSGNLFDLESGRRVARNALAVATEFKLSADDRQALWHAALLKDLGLVLSIRDMVEQEIATSSEEANALKSRFKPMWKALSLIDFLKAPLNLVSYSYEKYRGNGGSAGARKTEIPLGAKILAVVRAFEYMTSNPSPEKVKTPKAAVQEIIKGTEINFDPDVINAFLLYGRGIYFNKPQPSLDRRNTP